MAQGAPLPPFKHKRKKAATGELDDDMVVIDAPDLERVRRGLGVFAGGAFGKAARTGDNTINLLSDNDDDDDDDDVRIVSRPRPSSSSNRRGGGGGGGGGAAAAAAAPRASVSALKTKLDASLRSTSEFLRRLATMNLLPAVGPAEASSDIYPLVFNGVMAPTASTRAFASFATEFVWLIVAASGDISSSAIDPVTSFQYPLLAKAVLGLIGPSAAVYSRKFGRIPSFAPLRPTTVNEIATEVMELVAKEGAGITGREAFADAPVVMGRIRLAASKTMMAMVRVLSTMSSYSQSEITVMAPPYIALHQTLEWYCKTFASVCGDGHLHLANVVCMLSWAKLHIFKDFYEPLPPLSPSSSSSSSAGARHASIAEDVRRHLIVDAAGTSAELHDKTLAVVAFLDSACAFAVMMNNQTPDDPFMPAAPSFDSDEARYVESAIGHAAMACMMESEITTNYLSAIDRQTRPSLMQLSGQSPAAGAENRRTFGAVRGTLSRPWDIPNRGQAILIRPPFGLVCMPRLFSDAKIMTALNTNAGILSVPCGPFLSSAIAISFVRDTPARRGDSATDHLPRGRYVVQGVDTATRYGSYFVVGFLKEPRDWMSTLSEAVAGTMRYKPVSPATVAEAAAAARRQLEFKVYMDREAIWNTFVPQSPPASPVLAAARGGGGGGEAIPASPSPDPIEQFPDDRGTPVRKPRYPKLALLLSPVAAPPPEDIFDTPPASPARLRYPELKLPDTPPPGAAAAAAAGDDDDDDDDDDNNAAAAAATAAAASPRRDSPRGSQVRGSMPSLERGTEPQVEANLPNLPFDEMHPLVEGMARMRVHGHRQPTHKPNRRFGTDDNSAWR